MVVLLGIVGENGENDSRRGETLVSLRGGNRDGAALVAPLPVPRRRAPTLRVGVPDGMRELRC